MSRTRLVARNVLATLATQLVSWALAFAVTLYLPRYVGAAGLGKLAFAGAFVSLFGVLVPLGTSTVLVREIARDRSCASKLLAASILLRIPLGLLMTVLAIATADWLGYSSLVRTLVTICALGMIVGTINDALASTLQGHENLVRQSAAILTNKFLASLLTIGLILYGGASHRVPLWVLAAVGLVTGAAALVVNAATVFPYVKADWKGACDQGKALWRAGLLMNRDCLRLLREVSPWPSLLTVKNMAAAGLPFVGVLMFRTLYNQVDIPILSYLTNDTEVGWYSIASRLLGATLFIPVALATALLPTLTKLYATDGDKFALVLRRALGLILICAIPIAVPMILMPQKILFDLFHYPASFRPSEPVLMIYGFGCILWFVTQITGTALIVTNRQASIARISCIAMILTVAGCFLAIPLAQHLMHNGAVGAALVDVSVEIYMMTAFFLSLPRDLFQWDSCWKFAKGILAVIPLVLLLFLSHGSVYLVISLIVGILCYLLLNILLGSFDLKDFSTFKLLIQGRS